MPRRKMRERALAELGRGAPVPTSVLELRAVAGGERLSEADATALLAAAVKREAVSLVIDLMAYEQGQRDKDGKIIKNRKGVRVRSGAMVSFGRSGRGAAFMRDHRQTDSTAKGGTVLESRTSKLTEDGHYQVLATVELTEPTAVERALRRLMSAVSVGIEPLGPVHCTACKTEIFSRCFHFPFDVVQMADGTEHEVEWEYQDAGLIEISEVPIGAVHGASITAIRAALAGVTPDDVDEPDMPAPPEEMTMDPKTLKLLGLAATAGTAEVTQAVEALVADRAELAIVRGELAVATTELTTLRGEKKQTDADAFIAGALASGRIGNGESDKKVWRDLFALSPERARKLMAERPEGLATPVGAPRQSAIDPGAGPANPAAAAAAPAAGGEAITPELKTAFDAAGVDVGTAVDMAKKFGAKNPVATMTGALGLKKAG